MEKQDNGITRQVSVIAAASFMLISSVAVGGAFGGEGVADQQDGALTDQSTYLAPSGPAFAIWSVIYLGLIAYTIWQALPAQRHDDRQRATGWWVALSMVLNGLWLVAASFGPLWSTVLVIVLLLIVLARVIVLLGRSSARGWVERTVVDGANGLHFGWVTIATVVNITALLTDVAPEEWGQQADLWGILVLAAVLVITVSSAWATGRIAPALASAWGLAWVAIGRLADEPRSTPIAVAAIIVAVILLIAAVISSVRRLRGRSHAAVQKRR
ncbi:tryptophan-rich sensory protein [Microbacterium paludicola]|uniref:tryptophan-rich sensory protein n=1 Tax=Microbacterium paludicola TaxID=300019 RepID=UPI0011A4641D|nr:tryptophan-rich sensory protein [Microbacterium paludicola]